MSAAIDVYYDFRSPYAYFTSHQLRNIDVIRRGHAWRWRPVSINVLLNLQAGREPLAPYADALSAPKRAHVLADVFRLAAFHALPLQTPKPLRPDCLPALFIAAELEESERSAFNDAVFEAFWQQQQDISKPEVLRRCLARASTRHDLIDLAFGDAARVKITNETVAAFARGIFGVPTFAVDNEVFFGSDRLDLLLWTIEQRSAGTS